MPMSGLNNAADLRLDRTAARHMGDVKGRHDMLARVIRHAAKLRSNWRVGQARKETKRQIICSRPDGRDAG
jgi:hypothetical protein